jgi:alkylation response protein AidB-like acyl-CoA dehydrogenase
MKSKTSFEKLEQVLPAASSMTDSILTDDIHSNFPREAVDYIDNGNLLANLVPVEYGGELTSLEELFFKGRAISRRNITTSIAFGQSLLGSLSVWISGTHEQKIRMAALLMKGGSSCLALTEKEIGSDISSTQMELNQDGELNGEKWCINNATRGSSLTVLFKTAQGLSIAMIDKNKYQNKTIENLDKIKTHGIKGADISGIKFISLPIDTDDIIKRKGKGLEIVAKTMQVSRTLCSIFSLGALDSCLRMAVSFSCSRKLYGTSVMQMDGARSLINKAFYRHLANEAIAHTMCRAITLYPEGMSIYSALSKYQVTRNTQEGISILGEVLGARSYLLEEEFPLFEKFKRDHDVVGIFDGSSAVNLFVIAGQFGNILKHLEADASSEYLGVFQTSIDVPDFTGDGFKLTNRGFDFIFCSYFGIKEQIPIIIQELITAKIAELIRELAKHVQVDAKSYRARKLAELYCKVASTCLYCVYHLENNKKFSFDLGNDEILTQVCLETLDGDQLDYESVYLQKFTNEKFLFSHYEMKLNE